MVAQATSGGMPNLENAMDATLQAAAGAAPAVAAPPQPQPQQQQPVREAPSSIPHPSREFSESELESIRAGRQHARDTDTFIPSDGRMHRTGEVGGVRSQSAMQQPSIHAPEDPILVLAEELFSNSWKPGACVRTLRAECVEAARGMLLEEYPEKEAKKKAPAKRARKTTKAKAKEEEPVATPTEEPVVADAE